MNGWPAHSVDSGGEIQANAACPASGTQDPCTLEPSDGSSFNLGGAPAQEMPQYMVAAL